MNGAYALRLDFKLVGKVNTKKSMQPELLVDRKWNLFKTMVTHILLYGVEVWGSTISLNAWNEIEKIQKMFLRRQLGVKATTFYEVKLSETTVWPIKIVALQRV